MPALLVTDLYDEPNEKDSPSASVTLAPSVVKISFALLQTSYAVPNLTNRDRTSTQFGSAPKLSVPQSAAR